MSGRILIQKGRRFYHICRRTHQARYLFRPDEEMNRIIKGCLTRAAALTDVDILCFCFLSNHYHLIVRAPELNLHRFMEAFNGELGARTNRHRDYRKGTVFQGPNQPEPILDEESLWEMMAYVLCNPVRAGLTRDPEDWPGVSSLEAHRGNGKIEGKFLSRSRLRQLERRGEDNARQKAMHTKKFQLAKPPSLQDVSYREAGEKMLEYVEQKRQKILEEQAQSVEFKLHGYLGPKKALEIDWWGRPDEPKRSPSPLCHAATEERREAYGDKRRKTVDTYKQASKHLRDGGNPEFPTGTIPPGHLKAVGAVGSRSWPFEPP